MYCIIFMIIWSIPYPLVCQQTWKFCSCKKASLLGNLCKVSKRVAVGEFFWGDVLMWTFSLQWTGWPAVKSDHLTLPAPTSIFQHELSTQIVRSKHSTRNSRKIWAKHWLYPLYISYPWKGYGSEFCEISVGLAPKSNWLAPAGLRPQWGRRWKLTGADTIIYYRARYMPTWFCQNVLFQIYFWLSPLQILSSTIRPGTYTNLVLP